MFDLANYTTRPANRLLFFSAKLPAIYTLIILGLIFDFLIQFPFALVCALETRFARRYP
jgi:hypothetical protein